MNVFAYSMKKSGQDLSTSSSGIRLHTMTFTSDNRLVTCKMTYIGCKKYIHDLSVLENYQEGFYLGDRLWLSLLTEIFFEIYFLKDIQECAL